MQSLRLNHQQVQVIVDHCIDNLPDEACGLIAGHGEKTELVIPIDNVADNPQQHYLLDANEQLQALKKIEAQELEWIGVFHSHPKSDPLPSLEDIRSAELNTPDMAHVIVSLKHNTSRLQAWHIYEEQVDEVELLIGQQRSQAIAPMSRLQVWAVLLAILISMVLLLAISFTLLPPAPPIPTPQ